MLRAALKSLLARKVRLLLSTFAIVLGVAFVVGSLVFSATLDRSFTALFASTVGDVVVQPAGSGSTVASATVTVPASTVKELEAVPGAARVDGKVAAAGVFVVGSDGKVVSTFGAPGLGINYSTAPAGHGLTGLTLVAGRAPVGAGEVALEDTTATAAGYRIGDRVPIITAGTRARVVPRLVGLLGFPEGGSLNGVSLVAFDTPTAQRLFLGGRDAFSSVWVTAGDGVSQGELRTAVAAALHDPGLEAVTGDKAADAQASDLLKAISFLRTLLLVFAAISLVVGGFLIVNTFSVLVAQRSRELALLRALGASRRQVVGSVLFEAFLMGVLGSTVGIGVGALLAIGIRAIFGRVGLDLHGQPLVFQPSTVVVAYAVGVVVTVVAALLPARRTTRIAPVQALSDDVVLPESSIRRRLALGAVLVLLGAATTAVGLFTDVSRGLLVAGVGLFLILLGVAAASPWLGRPFLSLAAVVYRRAFGAVGTLAGQNSLRNPRRTTATASALMIGLAVGCTMAIIGASAKASVDQAVGKSFVGDYVVGNAFGQPFSPSIARQVAQVPGVTGVVRQRVFFAEVNGEGRGIAALDPGSLAAMGVHVLEGSARGITGRGVLVEQSLADQQHLAVGDRVTLTRVPRGTEKLTVAGITEDNQVVLFRMLTSIETADRMGLPAADNQLTVFTRSRDAATRAALDHLVARYPIITVADEGQYAAQQRAPIDQIVLMIFALLGLALLIAVLGIVNTLALSVIERTREVGLLRAIGVSRPQLRRMITLESVVIAVLGALLGIVLGVVFGVAMMYGLRDQGLEAISVPWLQLAVFLLVSVVVGVLAAVLPSRRAARLDVLRAIATD